ncbi:MAG: sensor histidine kinase [Eubacterium sp.]|jgi:ABC-type multidrug transport system fused ATPase/permease subunit|nr:sensor histidine kinase [Eubacterium sp.]
MEYMDILAAISAVYAIVSMYGTGYILSRFTKPFIENKRGSACIGIAYFATMLLLYLVPIEINVFAVYSLGILSAYLVMCRIDRRNYKQKTFLAATFFSLRWLSAYMTRILTNSVYNIKAVSDAYYIPEKQLLAKILIFGGVELLDRVISLALLGISAGYIVKTYVYKREDMSRKEMFMLIVPSITGMTGYGILIRYQTSSGMSWMEPIYGLYNGLAFLHFGISILTIVVMTVLFQNIKVRQEEKLQNELLATQIDSIERHIRQVESLYQNIRSIRHDMTNHILTLERLYAGNNVAEAMDYGEELKSALSQIAGEIKSGNPVTDVILQELKNEAEKRKIRFQSDFYYPTGTNINAFDVSVILNNALQNAMENARKSEAPYISVLSYHRNHAYMIEISNSFTGNLQWDEERGLPVTSKEKTEGHGYGLSNIRMVARKYAGDIAIDVKDHEFHLSIMLMME